MGKCINCGRTAIPLSSGLCYRCSCFRLTALKECSTSELVSELRKRRDGVAIFEIEKNESFEIQTWDRVDKIKDYDSGQGKAIILIRITD